MSPAQVALLKACIQADRAWRVNQRNFNLGQEEYESNDMRGVECAPYTSYSERTASALQAAGLVDLVSLYGGHTYAFLGKYDPYEALK